ncbi:hypothetical protein ACXKGW_29630, partial [Klebsiella pneumoniae subsp. pneumoniae]
MKPTTTRKALRWFFQILAKLPAALLLRVSSVDHHRLAADPVGQRAEKRLHQHIGQQHEGHGFAG